MRYYLAEAIRLNGLPADRRRAEISQMPLGTRTTIAVLAKKLRGKQDGYQRSTHKPKCRNAA